LLSHSLLNQELQLAFNQWDKGSDPSEPTTSF
jgi:hypothetical protein